MKNIWRITALILALSLIAALSVSCADSADDPGDTTEPEVTETDAMTEDTAEQPKDPGPEETFTILENGKFNCVIVYPEDESDLIRNSASAISVELGKLAGGLGPLAFSDGHFNEEKYADRCLILVGMTNVSGTGEFTASSVYGRVTAKLIGNKYQINISDDKDGAAFVEKMKELAGESPESITIDSSWNISIDTAPETVHKIVTFDGGHNGTLEENRDGSFTKKVWCGEREKFAEYVDKCAANGFTVVSSRDNGYNLEAVLEGKGIMAVVSTNDDTDCIRIMALPEDNFVSLSLDPEDYGTDYERWIGYASDYVDGFDLDYIITDNSNVLAWTSSYRLNALYRGYRATGDGRYLSKMADGLYGIYLLAEDKDGDGYRNWGFDGPADEGIGYNEYACHSGAMAGAAADFLNLLAGQPELCGTVSEKYGITYSEIADYILEVTVNDIIPSFDRDWSDQYGVYLNRPGCWNFSGTDKELSLPHNQYLMMAYALIELAKLDVGKETADRYMHMAEAMIRVFDSFVTRNENGTMFWHYNDSLFEGDYSGTVEDPSHGIMDLRTVIAAHSAGIAFTTEDLRAFGKTYDETAAFDPAPCFVPKLYSYIDGVGDPQFAYVQFIYDLSPFSEYSWDRGRRYTESAYSDPGQAEDSLRILAYHPGAPAPEPFSLTSPSDGESGADPEFTVFRWENSVRASEYVLTVARDSAFEDIVLERDGLLETSALVTDSLEAGKEYFWKVTAKTTGGKETESAVSSFRTK